MTSSGVYSDEFLAAWADRPHPHQASVSRHRLLHSDRQCSSQAGCFTVTGAGLHVEVLGARTPLRDQGRSSGQAVMGPWEGRERGRSWAEKVPCGHVQSELHVWQLALGLGVLVWMCHQAMGTSGPPWRGPSVHSGKPVLAYPPLLLPLGEAHLWVTMKFKGRQVPYPPHPVPDTLQGAGCRCEPSREDTADALGEPAPWGRGESCGGRGRAWGLCCPLAGLSLTCPRRGPASTCTGACLRAGVWLRTLPRCRRAPVHRPPTKPSTEGGRLHLSAPRFCTADRSVRGRVPGLSCWPPHWEFLVPPAVWSVCTQGSPTTPRFSIGASVTPVTRPQEQLRASPHRAALSWGDMHRSEGQERPHIPGMKSGGGGQPAEQTPP